MKRYGPTPPYPRNEIEWVPKPGCCGFHGARQPAAPHVLRRAPHAHGRAQSDRGGRCPRLGQIEIGNLNVFPQGCWLWPEDTDYDGVRGRIGNRNYFNRNLMLGACRLIEIGDDNMFGPDTCITDSNRTCGAGITQGHAKINEGRVRIGNSCWIGAKTIILRDVKLGDGCVVGSGAVVTHSFPPDSVVVGVPARVLKVRRPEMTTGVADPLPEYRESSIRLRNRGQIA
jgi:acetyltransferase-like isoleucine patch superfamily enzyme